MRHLLLEIIAISGKAKHGHHARDTRQFGASEACGFLSRPLRNESTLTVP
jgi:hypothetical protein